MDKNLDMVMVQYKVVSTAIEWLGNKVSDTLRERERERCGRRSATIEELKFVIQNHFCDLEPADMV